MKPQSGPSGKRGRRQAPPAPPSDRRSWSVWAIALSNLEKYKEADRILRQALRIDRARDDPVYVAYDLEALGQNQFYQGNLEQAKPFILEALGLPALQGPLSPGVGDNLNLLGQIAYMRHDLPAAERYFAGTSRSTGKSSGQIIPIPATMNNLARVLLEQRRYKDAAPLLEHAIAIGERERGEGSANMAFAYSNLAIVRSHTGRLREAETLFGKAIAIARKNKHPSLGPTLADFAQLMCSTGRTGDGLKLLDEAAPVTRADYPDNSWSAWVEKIKGECLLARDGSRKEEWRSRRARRSS